MGWSCVAQQAERVQRVLALEEMNILQKSRNYTRIKIMPLLIGYMIGPKYVCSANRTINKNVEE